MPARFYPAQSSELEGGNLNPAAFGQMYDLYLLRNAQLSVEAAMASMSDSGNESSEDFDAMFEAQLDQVQPDEDFPAEVENEFQQLANGEIFNLFPF